MKLTQLTQLGLILHEVYHDLGLQGVATPAGLSVLCPGSCCLTEAITIQVLNGALQCIK